MSASDPISAELRFPLFLTAYDPSDLPGGSVDPLGFERGYLFLADKILPGLTNVASRPRYLSILCAGAYLAEVSLTDSPREQYQRRLGCIQRLERFWALANVLASEHAHDGDLLLSGIRGVTYATRKAESLARSSARRVNSDFRLLSRQTPYGAVGIYGVVAEGMRLLDRKTFNLTPDLGERLAEGFLDESEMPSVLRKAVRDNGELSIAQLTDWGQRAHISGQPTATERICFREMLHQHPVRSRMATLLSSCPFRNEKESELKRLARLQSQFAGDSSQRDLSEAISAILAYEKCYQLVALVFERLLWLGRHLPAASVAPADLRDDPVIHTVRERLPQASAQFGHALVDAQSNDFRHEIERMEETRRFLERAASACASADGIAREVMGRHSDVQRGKFDRGRRKMPWLEMTADRISLTMTRVGGLDWEVTDPADIVPHPYRLNSADAMIMAAEVP